MRLRYPPFRGAERYGMPGQPSACHRKCPVGAPTGGEARLASRGAGEYSLLTSWLRLFSRAEHILAPRALPRFSATTGPAATVSPSIAFPVLPVIRPTLLHRFLDGARTVSPVARHVLATVLSLPPRRSDMPPRSVCAHVMLPSPDHRGLGLRIIFLSRPLLGSLTLRPGDSLTIPRMALSVGFIRFVSSTNATQATGSLTLPPVGFVSH